MRRFLIFGPTLLIAACGIGTETAVSTGGISRSETSLQTNRYGMPTATPKTVISSDGKILLTIDRDGTYLVGGTHGDIPKGRYSNAGGKPCYWARLRTMDSNDVIQSRETSQPQEIEIQASDTAFLTRNCGTWQFISIF